ncbi:uncharacterized protein LOC144700720 isoform X2 [Wolffia australiana]
MGSFTGQIPASKIAQNSPPSSHFCSKLPSYGRNLPITARKYRRCFLGVRAQSREVSGAGTDKDEGSSLVKSGLNQSGVGGKDSRGKSETETPKSSGGSKGLLRTPTSGGVQSATSAHSLPHPPLAVRNLMEQAKFAHLCTIMSRMHHRREGYPFGSLVDFATDSMGHPIFCFSPLAIHTRNLLADPRCTLVVQIPGWSGLSNARVTIFGNILPLPDDEQEWARKRYIEKHQQWASQQWGNFYYHRMQTISDIYFIGGFGTVAWIDVSEYESLQPDKIAIGGGEIYLKTKGRSTMSLSYPSIARAQIFV